MNRENTYLMSPTPYKEQIEELKEELSETRALARELLKNVKSWDQEIGWEDKDDLLVKKAEEMLMEEK